MAASKKGSKSSKTAHVLNVLSGPKADAEEIREIVPEEQPSPAAESGQPPEQPAVAAVPTAPRQPVRAPILEMARASDDALAEQIADLLEQEMADELPVESENGYDEQVQGGDEAMPASQEDTIMEDSRIPLSEEDVSAQQAQGSEPLEETTATAPVEDLPVSEPVAPEAAGAVDLEEEVPEEASTEQQVPVIAAQEQPNAVPTAPAEKPADKKGQEDTATEYPTPQKFIEVDDFCHVNVMQALVDEKCMKYIKMFGLCDCSRCVADVKALALTSLQPKYLVMHKGEVIPMLTVYEGRFSSAVTAQLINACKVVMDNPRHIR